ncbi:large conductance mechanosensitive channel protein MscL [Nocardia seriolae]|uniref:Large-conductance mechanosensitive channel n=1 Tax=Nocardia seriolae TaxID=37332 RepID=A0A0B8N2X4_9NOCA|nr:large conductance mechanosensitive channel protein MscL [Nocardia seriolae]APA95603.1 Large-conductance mechanosensitive channel [Nocardia seriolae]MTJ66262.1 large conductance mechanosensitive channel protein MscL [Nocardia seriolae]MTJ69916.1 large conductance mechanosensitive channel protein MscL [Nocardia seriolae]MTJ85825.1 large conductance mechanosensitive channel protein MscL [Nocardia seriolae]MTK29821.1 large conductance mechanosensitive channel protein MscL [Nocardia seriolae]
MLKGFKDFLLRGNVVDLAVAVVMGTAFVAIVTAFSDGVINPLLAVFGGSNQLGLGFQLVADKPATFVAIGPIITAAVNFVIIAALLYFVIVIPAKKAQDRWGDKDDAALSDNELLHQIRDLLAERGAGGKHEN